MRISRGVVVGLTGLSLLLVSCGGGDDAADDVTPATEAPTGGGSDEAATTSFTSVSAEDAAAITENPPDGLVILDVRTPEEYAEGHLDGAVLVDFYEPDFADQLAALDKDVPYLVYCRSGNRSGQTIPLMQQLGFDSAVDVDGGILAWAAAGLPTTTG